jgi:voltage-gated potassium channel Kch
MRQQPYAQAAEAELASAGKMETAVPNSLELPMSKHGLKARLRYAFDRSMAAGTIALVGWLALISFFVVMFAAALIALGGIQPAGDQKMGFLEGFWDALLHALDSGTIANDVGWGFRLVMLAVTLTGVSIVAVLIGAITTGLQTRLDELRRGRSIVLEDDHTIILNWSESIFEILSQLAIANESRKRPCIVIMADRDKLEMEAEIASKAPHLRNTRVVCRTGDPTDLLDLKLVNPASCRSIIILSPNSGHADASVIKTILALVSDPERREQPYRIAAEIRETANAEVARVVGQSEVQLVLADELIARIIVQSTRHPGLSGVYSELLDFEGCEIYPASQPELAGKSFGEAALCYKTSTLIGIVDAERGALLNPAAETVIGEDSTLLLIAEDDLTIRLANPPALPQPENSSVAAPAQQQRRERTLLIGWNRLAPTIIRELSRCTVGGSVLTIATRNTDLVSEALARLSLSAGFEIETRGVDSTRRAEVEALDPLSYDHVLVLGDGNELDVQAADTRTLVTLLHLRAIRDAANARMNIVSEVIDVRNIALAERARVDDFVVSSRLVSLMLAQASENDQFEAIFEELLDPAGSEIYLKPAALYVSVREERTFYEVTRAALARGETAIGHHLVGSGTSAGKSAIVVNPTKSDRIAYSERDRIIVLARD